MSSALAIAGSDPTGGAGLQLDVQVFRAHGVHGAAVATALTVQDRLKVHKVLPVFPSLVLDQLRVLLRDLRPEAIKLGMLATDDVARSVQLGLAELDRGETARPPLVVDPVLAASDGTPLLERRAWSTLCQLIEGSALVTPNLPEAAALTGRNLGTRDDCERAARAFVAELGARAVLIKGGHREGPPDDLLGVAEGDGIALRWLPGERSPGGPLRGTGCALASAIAAQLALGRPLADAVEAGRRFVAEAIRRAHASAGDQRFLVFS